MKILNYGVYDIRKVQFGHIGDVKRQAHWEIETHFGISEKPDIKGVHLFTVGVAVFLLIDKIDAKLTSETKFYLYLEGDDIMPGGEENYRKITELTQIAIDHARLMFYQETVGTKWHEGLIPIFPFEDLLVRVKNSVFEKLN